MTIKKNKPMEAQSTSGDDAPEQAKALIPGQPLDVILAKQRAKVKAEEALKKADDDLSAALGTEPRKLTIDGVLYKVAVRNGRPFLRSFFSAEQLAHMAEQAKA